MKCYGGLFNQKMATQSSAVCFILPEKLIDKCFVTVHQILEIDKLIASIFWEEK